MPSELTRRLRELHASASTGDPATRARLEDELARRFAAIHPPRRRLRWPTWTAIAAGTTLACALPSDYEVSVGQRLGIVMAPTIAARVDPREVARFVEATWDIERMAVQVRAERRIDGPGSSANEDVRIQLDMLGSDLDADEVWIRLRERFPALDQARREALDLGGTVHGTVGGWLAHDVLDVDVDRGGIEEARRRIVAELEAQGMDAEAEIDVVEGEGKREVRVEVRAHARDP